ncbi:MAG TPA: two-component sensor histidine kinase, partial [Segetibacter sp.]
MILLETLGIPGAFLIGTIGMLCLAIALIVFIIFHQRNVIRYQLKMQQMDAEQQKVLLQASIKFQEEERQKIAADLHDDAGPLLATARLYLTENLVNQNKETQLHS